MWFAIDTLEYLRRGGRIGGARAWIGSALKIKPILTLEEEITPVERVRTRARSIERLRDYARQRHESGLDAWVIQHIQDPETADALADDCREIFGCEPVFISEIGPRHRRPRRPRPARRRQRQQRRRMSCSGPRGEPGPEAPPAVPGTPRPARSPRVSSISSTRTNLTRGRPWGSPRPTSAWSIACQSSKLT